jgi:hypothetical protein
LFCKLTFLPSLLGSRRAAAVPPRSWAPLCCWLLAVVPPCSWASAVLLLSLRAPGLPIAVAVVPLGSRALRGSSLLSLCSGAPVFGSCLRLVSCLLRGYFVLPLRFGLFLAPGSWACAAAVPGSRLLCSWAGAAAPLRAPARSCSCALLFAAAPAPGSCLRLLSSAGASVLQLSCSPLRFELSPCCAASLLQSRRCSWCSRCLLPPPRASTTAAPPPAAFLVAAVPVAAPGSHFFSLLLPPRAVARLGLLLGGSWLVVPSCPSPPCPHTPRFLALLLLLKLHCCSSTSCFLRLVCPPLFATFLLVCSSGSLLALAPAPCTHTHTHIGFIVCCLFRTFYFTLFHFI